jgi:hypothetical protein
VRRGAIAVAGLLALATSGLAGQDRPRLDLSLKTSGTGPPQAVVSIHDLLADEQYVSAMRSGFPLYVALTVELRKAQALWDRSVDRQVVEYVVTYDPVRQVYVVEKPDTTEDLGDRAALERKLETVYIVPLNPDGPGQYHYRASVSARMLSDEDVDEVYAWLKGDSASAADRGRPGFLTRAARKVLTQVAPLPRLTLERDTEDFAVGR